jgi:hypothetical protein
VDEPPSAGRPRESVAIGQSVVPPSPPGVAGARQMLKLGPPAPPSMAVSQIAPPEQAWLGSVVLQSATQVPVPADEA